MLPTYKKLQDDIYKCAAEFSKEHEWGITYNTMVMLAFFHCNGNDYSKQLVEDILEDCNFHTINKIIHEGRYIDAIDKFKEYWDFSEEE